MRILELSPAPMATPASPRSLELANEFWSQFETPSPIRSLLRTPMSARRWSAMRPARQAVTPAPDAPYKSLRPPQLHFAEGQGGSTWPNDIPASLGAHLTNLAWKDVAGATHVNVHVTADEVDASTLFLSVPYVTAASLVPLRAASCDRSIPVYVHGSDPNSGDTFVMGRYSITGDPPLEKNKAGETVLCLTRVCTTVTPVRLDPDSSHARVYKRRIPEYYCCIGCGEGIGCFNEELRLAKCTRH